MRQQAQHAVGHGAAELVAHLRVVQVARFGVVCPLAFQATAQHQQGRQRRAQRGLVPHRLPGGRVQVHRLQETGTPVARIGPFLFALLGHAEDGLPFVQLSGELMAEVAQVPQHQHHRVLALALAGKGRGLVGTGFAVATPHQRQPVGHRALAERRVRRQPQCGEVAIQAVQAHHAVSRQALQQVVQRRQLRFRQGRERRLRVVLRVVHGSGPGSQEQGRECRREPGRPGGPPSLRPSRTAHQRSSSSREPRHANPRGRPA